MQFLCIFLLDHAYGSSWEELVKDINPLSWCCFLYLVLFSAETIYVRIANVQVIMLESALMWQFVTIVPCLGK